MSRSQDSDMLAPVVTIGIPFFNPGSYIEDAIRSVFAQTYTNWELILIDDGSQDGSLERVRSIVDPRVRVISDGKNLGLVDRLNQIAQLASGQFIARMDADDLMHPERIAKQLKLLQTHPELDVVDTGAYILDMKGNPAGLLGLKPGLPTPLKLLKRGEILHASVLARKKWFVENPYDPVYPRAEDRELFARTYYTSNFAHIPEPLYFYRFAGNVRLKPYLSSYSSERKVLLRYGPDMVGWPWTFALYARSLVKSGILIGLSWFGLEQNVTRRSYESLDEQHQNEAVIVLERIRKQHVPGW